jgi:asparagine synthetase B (glutamine-hydrolysing)
MRQSGVEIRAPFLDLDLVELALTMPDWVRSADGDRRWAQRQAFASYLSPAVRARRGKVHFDYRLAQHLAHPWVRDLLERSQLAEDGLLERGPVLAMYDDLQAAVARDITTIPSLAARLWAIVGVETWWRYVVR